MREPMEESWRSIVAVPQPDLNRPARIVAEVYDDAYTPFDVMYVLAGWVLDNPLLLEQFRAYIDSEGVTDQDFTGGEAEAHLWAVVRLLTVVFQVLPHHVVYITGKKGWVN